MQVVYCIWLTFVSVSKTDHILNRKKPLFRHSDIVSYAYVMCETLQTAVTKVFPKYELNSFLKVLTLSHGDHKMKAMISPSKVADQLP